MRRPGAAVVPVLAMTALLGCTAERADRAPAAGASSSASSPTRPAQPPTSAVPSPSEAATAGDEPSGSAAPGPDRFVADRAMADVRHLAGRIGPRLATAPAYARAGRWVARRFRALGYDVERQTFWVPAGDSWGVPVRAGRSFNVVATPPGLDPARPHRLVGAHLDTVAVAPGAEDNASGVAVVLELARLAARTPTRPATVFAAFGAEEPRGPGDGLHHFGSQHYVRTMPRAVRRSLVAMASLDRVGVGTTVPVCTGPQSSGHVQRAVLRTARRTGVPAVACDNTASDHWSFEKAGYPVVRLGSTSYAAYHSAADLPPVVSPAQLARTGRLAWAWLSGG